jgi:hypothetical protein
MKGIMPFPSWKGFKPMSMESSNALGALISRIAAKVEVDVHHDHGTAYSVTITNEDKSLTFTFDQGGRKPDAADAISALFARAGLIARGEAAFYRSFYEKAYKASLEEEGKPLPDEYVAHYEEYKRVAEECWRVFGDWFGRKWE